MELRKMPSNITCSSEESGCQAHEISLLSKPYRQRTATFPSQKKTEYTVQDDVRYFKGFRSSPRSGQQRKCVSSVNLAMPTDLQQSPRSPVSQSDIICASATPTEMYLTPASSIESLNVSKVYDCPASGEVHPRLLSRKTSEV